MGPAEDRPGMAHFSTGIISVFCTGPDIEEAGIRHVQLKSRVFGGGSGDPRAWWPTLQLWGIGECGRGPSSSAGSSKYLAVGPDKNNQWEGESAAGIAGRPAQAWP
jgi:hypothetical protein